MGRPDLRRIEEEGEESRPARPRRETSRRGGFRRSESAAPETKIKVGDVIEGTVAHITDYGAFVELAPDVTGLIHISALSDDYVKRVEDVVKTGDLVKVEVLNIDDRGRYKLRRIVPETEEKKPQTEEEKPPPFEDRW